MKQTFPRNWAQIFNLATKMYNGIVKYAATIPITLVNAPQMLASKTAFRNVGDTFNMARSNARVAYQVSTPAQEALHAWLLTARKILAVQLGDRWSAAWAAAGFVSPSTQVPETIEARIGLGKSLESYFTANPARERPDDDVTAAKASEMTDAAILGQNAVVTAEAALKTADEARPPAKANLLGLFSDLLSNLNRKLAKDDPRWLEFGLQMPSIDATPAAPTGLRAIVVDGQLQLRCDATEYASRYRFRGKVVGLEDNYKLLGSSPLPGVDLNGISAGLTRDIVVQAVNGNTQGVACDPIVVTMPLTETKTDAPAAPASELAPLTAITPNGNGSSNGNGNGSSNGNGSRRPARVS